MILNIWEKNSFSISVWLFFRLLGIVYLSAFISYWLQIPGLIGENGILPANVYLEASSYALGDKAYYYLPTIFWLDSSDSFISLVTICGILFSIFLTIGILTLPISIILFIIHLSLVVIGQNFMSFQWDALLLEVGFLSIFIAPRNFLHRTTKLFTPSRVLLLLFWFLLFRLMFSSGIGKIISGDPTWKNLTALSFHYFTQPLPNPVSWYVHQFPDWFHKLTVVIMLFVEIFIPFLYFAPRLFRHIAGILTIILQIIIMITGNYTYFNILTISICFLLFDDAFLQQHLPEIVKNKFNLAPGYAKKPKIVLRNLPTYVLAIIIAFLGLVQLSVSVFGYWNQPIAVQEVVKTVSPLSIVNRYGLFTVMTTDRPEIVIEGSSDGVNWKEYKFRYKPSDLDKVLPLVAPYQPRLDWQMWFAALGSYQRNPWFIKLIERLASNTPEVLELLEENPFPDKRPIYIRALRYKYEFTNYSERQEGGNIWKRELLGYYLPEVRVN